MVLAARLELASRPNPGLTAYKTAALPICATPEQVALSAGVEPASFRLRLTRLEDETDTRAMELMSRLELLSAVYEAAALPVELHQQAGARGRIQTFNFRFVGAALYSVELLRQFCETLRRGDGETR